MKRIFILLTVLVVVSGSLLFSQETPPSFKNMVAVGDSVTAGFQSFSLNLKGQQAAYPSLIARQVGTFLFLPLITEPGIPNELVLIDPGPPPVLETTPGPSGTRVFPTIIPQNIAVPSQSVVDALTVRPELPLDSLEDIILGVPSLVIPQLGIPPLSQIEMGFALEPTFTLFWLGPADVIGAVLEADPALATPIEVFQDAYGKAVGAILLTGSKVVAANVPDPTHVPFLVSAEEVAALVGAPIEIIGPPLGIESGDYVTAFGVDLVSGILSGQIPGPLPPNVVMTAAEIQQLRVIIATMNAIIGQVSQVLGFPVVDAFSAFEEIEANGYPVGDVTITNDFLNGMFSLDGVHPSNTAHAIVANLFIAKMSEVWGLPIPPVDVEAVAAQDPLFPASLGGTESSSLLSVDEVTFRSFVNAIVPRRQTEQTGQSGFSSGDDPVDLGGIEPLGWKDLDGLDFSGVKLQPGPVRDTRELKKRLRGRGIAVE